MTPFIRPILAALAGLCLYGSLAGEARATDYTWQGLGGSDEWQDTLGNWNLPLYPGYNTNDTALFTSVTQSYNTISAGTLTVASISYIAPGYALTLNSRFNVTNGITATYANAPDLTVNGNVLLGASTIKSLSGTGVLRQVPFTGPVTVVGPSSSFGGRLALDLSLTVGDGTHAASLALTGTFPKDNTGTTLVNTNATLVGGAVNALSGLSAHVINGTLSLSGGSNTVDSLSGTGTVSLGSNTLTINNSGTFSGSVTGTGGSIIKAGAGTQTFSGSNTYTNATTINAGTLEAASTNALGGTSSVTVNTGGTLLLSGAGTDRINNAATLTLHGQSLATAALNTGGRAETVGALTLSSNSVIDLGTLNGSNVLRFGDSSAIAWTGQLSIWNWSGTLMTGGGLDQVSFTAVDGTALSSTQLSQIRFFSGAGTGDLGTAMFVSGMTGEIVPVPEPATVLSGCLLMSLVGWRERKRLARLIRR